MERRRSSASLGILSPCRLGSTSSAIKTETLNTSWLSDFTVEGTIGRGKFAVVKKCVEKSTGQQFAAKCIRKRRHNRDCTPDILHEIAVLEMGTKHPHLISLHRVYETNSEFVLMLEYAAGGEIFDHCVGVKDTFTEDASRRLMKQILNAVDFLHDNDIVHLDLKPQNILLSKDGADPEAAIKLVDFGLSKYIAQGLEIREILGTPDYVAPEVLNYEPISTATDIWSLGVVAYVMLTGVSPFLGETKQETLMNVTTALLDFPADLFDKLSPFCRDFIHKMLQKDPCDRVCVKQTLSHPWITGVTPPAGSLSLPDQEEDEAHEEVFVNGDLSTPNGECAASDASSSLHGESTRSASAEKPDSCPTASETVKFIAEDSGRDTGSEAGEGKQSSNDDDDSDVDYNGNKVDDDVQETKFPDGYQCSPGGTQEDFDDSATSAVDLVTGDKVPSPRPIDDTVPSSCQTAGSGLTSAHCGSSLCSTVYSQSCFSNVKREEGSLIREERSPTPSPKITNLSLSSSTPTSPAKTPFLLNDAPVSGGAEYTEPGVKPLPSYFDLAEKVVAKSVVDNGTTDIPDPPSLVHTTDPCLKRRKFDYCAKPEQNATEISVAD